jgi:hypothetical protein
MLNIVPYMFRRAQFLDGGTVPHRHGRRSTCRQDARASVPRTRSVSPKVVFDNTGPVEPFAKTLPEKDGPVVYHCAGQGGQAPQSDPANVSAMLT